MIEALWFLPVIFLAIAFVYSLGGFAGGSSYVLALTLAGLPHSQIPTTSLLCNIVVSGIVFMSFCSAGHFRFRLAFPFIAGSVPAAYLAAKIHLPKEIFIVLLAIALITASLRILFSKKEFIGNHLPAGLKLYFIGIPLGAIMGFLSGLLGIGGGIFLWPTLLLLRWTNVKEASAAASFFILVNSFSGLAGHLQKGFNLPESAVLLAIFSGVGGFIGSSVGSRKIAPLYLQRGFALLLCVLAIQFLSKVL